MKKIASLIVLCVLAVGVQSLAQQQQIILNPGQYNNTGVTLSCYPLSNPPPQPYPPQPPIFVGTFETSPDRDCLERAPFADPRTIDRYIVNCQPVTHNNLYCTSTTIASSRVDDRCYGDLYRHETLPAAIHPDQMQHLRNVCTETTYNCFQNR
jgi:hypothetical protein